MEFRINEMGLRLSTFPHRRLTGINRFRLRIGDYRVIYTFENEVDGAKTEFGRTALLESDHEMPVMLLTCGKEAATTVEAVGTQAEAQLGRCSITFRNVHSRALPCPSFSKSALRRWVACHWR